MYNNLKQGYQITYKYTDGSAIKFRTTPIIETKRALNDKLMSLDKMEQVFEAVVTPIRYFLKKDKLKELSQ